MALTVKGNLDDFDGLLERLPLGPAPQSFLSTQRAGVLGRIPDKQQPQPHAVNAAHSGVLPPIRTDASAAPFPGANAGENLAQLTGEHPGEFPAIARPTNASSTAAGKREYEIGKPLVTAEPGTPEWDRQKLAQIEYSKSHPWGNPISEHPGVLGKIAHVFRRIGEGAGMALAPAELALTPGTELNQALQERDLRADLLKQEELLGRIHEPAPRERNVLIGGQPAVQRFDYGRNAWETEPGVAPYSAVATKAPRQLTFTEQEGRDVDDLMKQTNPATGRPYTRTEAIAAVHGAVSPAQRERVLTNPFEAFAYGTPEQKQAAQDFLRLEKKIGAGYRQPSELDERYRLYKHDPKAYAAMFGTKTGISEATATRMLNYFDRRRQDISKDFMLSTAERQQKLNEIEQLEQPFIEAAHGNQPGAGGGTGNDVVLTAPDGRQRTFVKGSNLYDQAVSQGWKARR